MIPLILGGILSGIGKKKQAKAQGRAIEQGLAAAQPVLQGAPQRLDPYAQSGASAQGFLNQILGLGGMPAIGGGGAGGGTAGVDPNSYFAANPDVAQEYARVASGGFGPNLPKAYDANNNGMVDRNEYAQFHYDRFGAAEGRPGVSGTAGAGTAGTTAPSGATGAGEALQSFRESLGYRDMLNQALGGVGANAAARGLLGSSGTGQAFQQEAGRLAQGTFGDFVNRLTGVAGLGQQAATNQAELDARLADLIFSGVAGAGQARAGGKGSILSGTGNFLSDLFLTRAGQTG